MISFISSYSFKLKIYCFLFIISGVGFSQGFFEKDWETIIDTTWGPGLPTNDKLEIFDSVWTIIDHKYACFQNLNLDWDEVRNRYRPEIENGVSRGRFAAIINHMSVQLKETHTWFTNSEVNVATPVLPGTPLIRGGGWGRDTTFSAGLSPLPDSSLLVYTVPTNHPLGLEPGDIILGYDGYPWKFLYKELLRREFPIQYQSRSGSNDKAFTHIWLNGAGMNWHLFDTIDIKKYYGEIIHLPTSLLVDNTTSVKYSEQLLVPGVPMDTAHWQISWGIVEGTNIGYLYIYRFFAPDIGIRFYNALDSLINIHNVDGLIIDVRVNSGGYFERTNEGLDLLFENDVPNLGLAIRNNPFDHYSMSTSRIYHLANDTTTFFNKPIAVLSGPFCISAGDFLIKRLQSHPNVKVFGKTSSTAFASSHNIQLGSFRVDYAYLNGFSEENPDQYLTHLEMDVDYEVSFTPDDVRNGDDTVVKTAIEWIVNSTNLKETTSGYLTYELLNNYPNPFNPSTTIRFSIPLRNNVTMKVFDILGNEIATLINEDKPAGSYEVEWNASELTSGIYFYQLRAGNFIETRKMILLK